MPSNVPPTEYLTIFLVKEGFTGESQIFKRPLELDRVRVALGPDRAGRLYVQTSQLREPRWLRLFRESIDPSTLDVKVASSAAVLLVESGARLLALTFGHGRHLLKLEAMEENFGFHAALNFMNRDRVRAIERKRFDALSRHSRENASREVALREFGLDRQQDLVRSITGAPRQGKEELGRRMSGRDSITVAVPTNIHLLADLVDQYKGLGLDQSYREEYAEIGQLAEIDRKDQRDRLNTLLVDKLRRGDLSRTWLAIPDAVDWSDVGDFKYSHARSAAPHVDIHLESYFDFIGGINELSFEKLKRHQVHSYSLSGDPRDSWSVFKCIYAELDTPDGTFFLDNGAWYRIDASLVATVNQEMSEIESSTVQFPSYSLREDEADYNARLAATDPDHLALMDRTLTLHGGGQSRFEFCDVFSSGNNKRLIHIKRFSGSQVLSHLFEQGVNSAKLFLFDSEFRTKVNESLPPGHRLEAPQVRPVPEDYEVAYGIAMRTRGQFVLPFFSAMALTRAHRDLSNLGFRVTCSKIQIGS